MISDWKAAVAVTWAALNLRIRGFDKVGRRHLVAAPESFSPGLRPRLVTAWLAFQSTARLPWSTCLTRAVAFCELAQRAGVAPRLRLGVVQRDPFLAHAWVELEGLTLESPPPAGALDELPE